MTVFNLGSINIDCVFQVPHLPEPGETLAATGYLSGLGGKGANQSVAVARAGCVVHHLGMVGPDGDRVLAEMTEYGVDVSHVGRVDGPTGTAMIMVDPQAENSIVILSGANRMQSEQALRATLATAKSGDTLLLQNETDGQALAAQEARARGLRVIYSAAPFDIAAVRSVLPDVSVLLLNEGEAAQLAEAMGRPVDTLDVPHIVVTRGAAGAFHYDSGSKTKTAYPSLSVAPVDTTGAGDTFAGYLAAALDEGLAWVEAMPLALGAAALSTTRPGAAQAIPARAVVVSAIRNQADRDTL